MGWTDQTFDLSQMWLQQVAHRSIMGVGVAERTGHDKPREKSLVYPKVFLATVNGGRSISKYRKDETVFSQSSSADAVFYIQKGKVKITVISEQGKEAVVAILGPDEFCGEGCLTGQPLRLATATAMTDCEIMRVEKAVMVRVLHEEPAFSEMFVSHLLARTIGLKRTWSTNCSIQARSAWRGPSCFSRILGRKANPNRSSRKSAKRHSQR